MVVGCEICEQSCDESDVLCPSCRETISRLAMFSQEKPLAPTGNAGGEVSAEAAGSRKDKPSKEPKRWRRPFSIFQRFERPLTLPYAG
jgi:protein gp37